MLPRAALCRVQPIPGAVRSYAISVATPKKLPGKHYPRVFKDQKAFQYNWYSRILATSTTSPIIFLHHNEFTAERLRALRSDILTAYRKAAPTPSLSGPNPVPASEPTLTVVRTSIFGAALRDLPGVNMKEVAQMLNNQKGSFAILSLPTLDPPRLSAVLRAMDRTVPPKPPKTDAEIKAELEAKNADPQQPGKRMKRSRPIRVPELKLMGAIVENRVFVPQQVKDVSKLPTLDTLRAQIVGLLSAPASQLAAVLSQASGGKLARTLEGLKKGLEAEGAPAEGEGASPSS